jgi:SAM-dependent methyltransferase
VAVRDSVDSSADLVARAAGDLAGSAAADWRFLLPIDERSRVLELSGRDDVALSFAFEVEQVVAVRSSTSQAALLAWRAKELGLPNVRVITGPLTEALPPPDGPFHVATLHDTLDRGVRLGAVADERILSTVRRSLTPHGSLWIAARNRFAWGSAGDAPAGSRGLDELQRLLRRAGYAALDTWAILPDVDRAQEIVPLDSKAAFDFVAERDRAAGRSAVSVALAKSAFRMGLAPRVVPAFGIVARPGRGPK